jgi:endonuclease/exonuclease/phosphatase family metal-dependent hydrolase
VKKISQQPNPFVKEKPLNHKLKQYYPKLANFSSSKKLFSSKIYQEISSQINEVLNNYEFGFIDGSYIKKDFYRIVNWNIERGLCFDGIVETLDLHPALSKADLFLLTETDSGMIRTRNQNVAKNLAKKLKCHYVFAPAYLNLSIGNAVENNYHGENNIALHGSAILSKYPIKNIQLINLPNCKDKMKGNDKRIGSQNALYLTVCYPDGDLEVVLSHLDAHSSPKQRADQIKIILDRLKDSSNPILLAGDWNTTCYDTRERLKTTLSFTYKLIRGISKMRDIHHLKPYLFYDRFLFDELEKEGFNYLDYNDAKGTMHFSVYDERVAKLLTEVMPAFCLKLLYQFLKWIKVDQGSMRVDWFSGKKIKVLKNHEFGSIKPMTFQGLKYKEKDISDHDPISIDISFKV